MRRYWQVLVLLIVNIVDAKAQPLILLESEKKEDIGEYTSIFKDSSNNLQIEDVISLSKNFMPCKNKIFSHAPSGNAYWIKLKVKKTTDFDYFLLVDNPSIQDIKVYSVDRQKGITVEYSGTRYPFLTRKTKSNFYVFKIQVSEQEEKNIYIRYIALRGEIPLTICTYNKVNEIIENKNLLWGIYFGGIISIVLYNTFLFFALKDKNYILYVIYFLIVALFNFSILGFSFKYLYPGKPELNRYFFSFNSLGGILALWFGLKFLNVKKYLPKFYLAGIVFMVLLILSFISNFISEVFYAFFFSILVLFIIIYIIITAILVLNKGYTPARYYLIATLFFFISVSVNQFRIIGIVPSTSITINIVFWGIIIEALLYSIALGDRYNEFKKQKESMQRELNKELELKIIDRVKNEEELNKLNASLKKTNIDLNNFIYTASHDLKGPIINIEGLINLLKTHEVSEDEMNEVYNMVLTSVSNFKDKVCDLAEISKVQQMRDDKIEVLNVQKMVDAVLENLKDEVIKSQALIQRDFSKCPTITFSKTNFTRIVENILSNALKFRSPNRKLEIKIDTFKTSNFNVLIIKDNGIGINPDYQDKIFSMFKKAHENEGRGIGLYLVKRIIENEGGLIEVQSEIDTGSTFKVYFRK